MTIPIIAFLFALAGILMIALSSNGKINTIGSGFLIGGMVTLLLASAHVSVHLG